MCPPLKQMKPRTKLDKEGTVIAQGAVAVFFYPQNERSHQYARKQLKRMAVR